MNNTKQGKHFERLLFPEIKKWIARPEILAIKGPRQAGKTTLLKMLKDWLIKERKVKAENIVFITFEDREILEKFSVDPKGYIKSFVGGQTNDRFYFLIDEFHYLEQGGQKLKFLFDIFENIKFIITGSSSLELVSKTGKFLVGRVFFLDLWQLSFEELITEKDKQLAVPFKEKSDLVRRFILQGKGFALPKEDIFLKDFQKRFEEYAVWGGYPAVIGAGKAETKRTILKNIFATYISKDIIELLKTADYNQFQILVRLLAVRIANLINFSNLSQDAQSYFKETKKQLSVLEETYIIKLVRPFFKNKTSELRKNPMLYFIDNGLRNYLIGNFGELERRSDLGQLVENTVFSQLQFKQEDHYDIKYWRTLGKAEVDFILEKRDGQVVPIEVKYSRFTVPKVSRSFRSFLEQYKPASALVLTKGFWGDDKIGKTTIKFVPVWYL